MAGGDIKKLPMFWDGLEGRVYEAVQSFRFVTIVAGWHWQQWRGS